MKTFQPHEIHIKLQFVTPCSKSKQEAGIGSCARHIEPWYWCLLKPFSPLNNIILWFDKHEVQTNPVTGRWTLKTIKKSSLLTNFKFRKHRTGQLEDLRSKDSGGPPFVCLETSLWKQDYSLCYKLVSFNDLSIYVIEQRLTPELDSAVSMWDRLFHT